MRVCQSPGRCDNVGKHPSDGTRTKQKQRDAGQDSQDEPDKPDNPQRNDGRTPVLFSWPRNGAVTLLLAAAAHLPNPCCCTQHRRQWQGTLRDTIVTSAVFACLACSRRCHTDANDESWRHTAAAATVSRHHDLFYSCRDAKPGMSQECFRLACRSRASGTPSVDARGREGQRRPLRIGLRSGLRARRYASKDSVHSERLSAGLFAVVVHA